MSTAERAVAAFVLDFFGTLDRMGYAREEQFESAIRRLELKSQNRQRLQGAAAVQQLIRQSKSVNS